MLTLLICHDCWIKIDQLNVPCFIISLFTAQHFSNVSTSIFRCLRIIVDLFHVLYCSGSMYVGVTVWFGWGGVVSLCRLKQCLSLHHLVWCKWGTRSRLPRYGGLVCWRCCICYICVMSYFICDVIPYVIFSAVGFIVVIGDIYMYLRVQSC